MLTLRRDEVKIYVDRNNRQWVVLDSEGNFWSLPSSDNPWDDRQPFNPAEDTELDPVPGHYRYILGILTHEKLSAL